MLRLISIAIGVSLVATPALAADDTANSTDAQVSSNVKSARSEASEERVICKSFVPLGSRLGKKKSCRTAREWAELRQQTRAQTEKMQQVGGKYE